MAASCPGAMRMLTLARAAGTSWLIASERGGASMASTDTAGLIHSRLVSDPSPMNSMPSSTPAWERNSSSVRSRGSASPVTKPGTATFPLESCSPLRMRVRIVSASATTPPNIPEWTPFSNTRTSTKTLTRPRSEVVRAGVPTRQFVLSAITITSASSR